MTSSSLFPYRLSISTPRSGLSWVGYEVPPEALSVTEERQQELVTLASGRALPRVGLRESLHRIRIASPEGHVLPTGRIGALKDLQIGDVCTISENLSSRSVLTIWGNAIVWSAPVITRVATDRETGLDYYSYQLEFVHSENSP